MSWLDGGNPYRISQVCVTSEETRWGEVLNGKVYVWGRALTHEEQLKILREGPDSVPGGRVE